MIRFSEFLKHIFITNKNESLEQFDRLRKTQTPQEVVQKLQKYGFYNVYATKDGKIVINGQYPLECSVFQEPNGSWAFRVDVEMNSIYAIISTVLYCGIVYLFDIKGMIPLVLSCSLGFGIISFVFRSKKKNTAKRLAKALSE